MMGQDEFNALVDRLDSKPHVSEVGVLIRELKAMRQNAGAEFVDVVFDGPPGPEAGRFVEAEHPPGTSVNVGRWIDRKNGYWALRVPRASPQSMFGDVGEFHRKFALPVAGENVGPHQIEPEDFERRLTFIDEELRELTLGYIAGDLARQADAICDLAYVVLGTGHFMGLPIDEAWAEVQRSNMAKSRDPADGGHKLGIHKPAGWTPPDVAGAVSAAARAWWNVERKGRV